MGVLARRGGGGRRQGSCHRRMEAFLGFVNSRMSVVGPGSHGSHFASGPHSCGTGSSDGFHSVYALCLPSPGRRRLQILLSFALVLPLLCLALSALNGP